MNVHAQLDRFQMFEDLLLSWGNSFYSNYCNCSSDRCKFVSRRGVAWDPASLGKALKIYKQGPTKGSFIHLRGFWEQVSNNVRNTISPDGRTNEILFHSKWRDIKAHFSVFWLLRLLILPLESFDLTANSLLLSRDERSQSHSCVRELHNITKRHGAYSSRQMIFTEFIWMTQ